MPARKRVNIESTENFQTLTSDRNIGQKSNFMEIIWYAIYKHHIM